MKILKRFGLGFAVMLSLYLIGITWMLYPFIMFVIIAVIALCVVSYLIGTVIMGD